jgi:hypothetical protein
VWATSGLTVYQVVARRDRAEVIAGRLDDAHTFALIRERRRSADCLASIDPTQSPNP